VRNQKTIDHGNNMALMLSLFSALKETSGIHKAYLLLNAKWLMKEYFN